MGACHCALFYDTFESDFGTPAEQTFVNLPEEVVQAKVKRVWFFTDPQQFSPSAYSRAKDIVLAELENKPVSLLGTVCPTWSALTPKSGNSQMDFASVVGKSNSGFVTGFGAVSISAPNSGVAGCAVATFVETSGGEPGHSGTLMYGVGFDGSTTLLGVYTGMAPTRSGNMRPRGSITLLPPATLDAHWHTYSVATPKRGTPIWLGCSDSKITQYAVCKHGVKPLTSNKTVYGVFIPICTRFGGSWICESHKFITKRSPLQ